MRIKLLVSGTFTPKPFFAATTPQMTIPPIEFLLVDRNVRQVVKMSHRRYVLGLGKIVAEGPSEAFAGDLHEQVKSWLGINF